MKQRPYLTRKIIGASMIFGMAGCLWTGGMVASGYSLKLSLGISAFVLFVVAWMLVGFYLWLGD